MSAKTRTYVALKILTSQATARIVLANSPESDVYRAVGTTNPEHPGFDHCLRLRRSLITKSAAGGHICFVTDVLSSGLATLRPPGQNRFPLPIAKRIIKQVLLALDYLHRECGYIHTGGSTSTPALMHADGHLSRSQIREHPCHNT
jgi:serine/threonine-protein kinase SRPK3